MAKRTIVELVDDIDETIISDGTGQTVSFGLHGTTYEIDLTHDHAAELEAALSLYIAKARRTSGPTRKKPPAPRSKEQTQAIRAWAQENGYQLSDRGRIPADIEASFHEHNGKPLSDEEREKIRQSQ